MLKEERVNQSSSDALLYTSCVATNYEETNGDFSNITMVASNNNNNTNNNNNAMREDAAIARSNDGTLYTINVLGHAAYEGVKITKDGVTSAPIADCNKCALRNLTSSGESLSENIHLVEQRDFKPGEKDIELEDKYLTRHIFYDAASRHEQVCTSQPNDGERASGKVEPSSTGRFQRHVEPLHQGQGVKTTSSYPSDDTNSSSDVAPWHVGSDTTTLSIQPRFNKKFDTVKSEMISPLSVEDQNNKSSRFHLLHATDNSDSQPPVQLKACPLKRKSPSSAHEEGMDLTTVVMQGSPKRSIALGNVANDAHRSGLGDKPSQGEAALLLSAKRPRSTNDSLDLVSCIWNHSSGERCRPAYCVPPSSKLSDPLPAAVRVDEEEVEGKEELVSQPKECALDEEGEHSPPWDTRLSEEVEKEEDEEEGEVDSAQVSPSSKVVEDCAVCGEEANGNFFGAVICLPCKSFFIRCTKDGEPCIFQHCSGDCNIKKQLRNRCQYCRYKRCLAVGMSRKEKPESVQAQDGRELCKVCQDLANGLHFGVHTCEGCKKFFRRGLKEHTTYVCKDVKTCRLNPRNRNNCRYCRYQKCLEVGMSREAIKMGRPRKVYSGHGMMDSHPPTTILLKVFEDHPHPEEASHLPDGFHDPHRDTEVFPRSFTGSDGKWQMPHPEQFHTHSAQNGNLENLMPSPRTLHYQTHVHVQPPSQHRRIASSSSTSSQATTMPENHSQTTSHAPIAAFLPPSPPLSSLPPSPPRTMHSHKHNFGQEEHQSYPGPHKDCASFDRSLSPLIANAKPYQSRQTNGYITPDTEVLRESSPSGVPQGYSRQLSVKQFNHDKAYLCQPSHSPHYPVRFETFDNVCVQSQALSKTHQPSFQTVLHEDAVGKYKNNARQSGVDERHIELVHEGNQHVETFSYRQQSTWDQRHFHQIDSPLARTTLGTEASPPLRQSMHTAEGDSITECPRIAPLRECDLTVCRRAVSPQNRYNSFISEYAEQHCAYVSVDSAWSQASNSSSRCHDPSHPDIRPYKVTFPLPHIASSVPPAQNMKHSLADADNCPDVFELKKVKCEALDLRVTVKSSEAPSAFVSRYCRDSIKELGHMSQDLSSASCAKTLPVTQRHVQVTDTGKPTLAACNVTKVETPNYDAHQGHRLRQTLNAASNLPSRQHRVSDTHASTPFRHVISHISDVVMPTSGGDKVTDSDVIISWTNGGDPFTPMTCGHPITCNHPSQGELARSDVLPHIPPKVIPHIPSHVDPHTTGHNPSHKVAPEWSSPEGDYISSKQNGFEMSCPTSRLDKSINNLESNLLSPTPSLDARWPREWALETSTPVSSNSSSLPSISTQGDSSDSSSQGRMSRLATEQFSLPAHSCSSGSPVPASNIAAAASASRDHSRMAVEAGEVSACSPGKEGAGPGGCAESASPNHFDPYTNEQALMYINELFQVVDTLSDATARSSQETPMAELDVLDEMFTKVYDYSPLKVTHFWRTLYSHLPRVNPGRWRTLLTPAHQDWILVITRNYLDQVEACDEIINPPSVNTNGLCELWPPRGEDRLHWKHFQERLARQTYAEAQFLLKLPEINKIPHEDLVKLGNNARLFGNTILMASREWFDPVQKKFKFFWNWKLPQNHPHNPFRNRIIQAGSRIFNLHMDETEVALMSALNILSPETATFKNVSLVSGHMQSLMKVLYYYLFSINVDPNDRIPELLAVMPKVRHMSMWYSNIILNMRADSISMDKTLQDLIQMASKLPRSPRNVEIRDV